MRLSQRIILGAATLDWKLYFYVNVFKMRISDAASQEDLSTVSMLSSSYYKVRYISKSQTTEIGKR